MHRHGYKGRKFGRARDPRRALMRGLAESLVINGSITTTQAKAKELVPYAEKLITKAKRGDLAARRMILRDLSVASSHKLVDELAPKLKSRTSGHLRLKSVGWRRGDSSSLATVSFVDDISAKVKTDAKTTKPKVTTPEEQAEQSTPTTTHDARQGSVEKTIQPKSVNLKQAPKRTGIRGNR